MNRTAHAVFAGIILTTQFASAQQPARVTILYDAFGAPSSLQKDWGFAALIEYGGRRILFDTGNDATFFASNVKQLNVELSRLDAVVISHRHGDHTTGLEVVIAANPRVPIYTPQEGAFFKSIAPKEFLARDASVPPNLRYFDGQEPARWQSGTPWPQGNFRVVTGTTEIFPGYFLLATRSEKPGTREMNEVSLAIRTPEGLAVSSAARTPASRRSWTLRPPSTSASTPRSEDFIWCRHHERRSIADTTRGDRSRRRLAV